jgi:hypothetical protein
MILQARRILFRGVKCSISWNEAPVWLYEVKECRDKLNEQFGAIKNRQVVNNLLATLAYS